MEEEGRRCGHRAGERPRGPLEEAPPRDGEAGPREASGLARSALRGSRPGRRAPAPLARPVGQPHRSCRPAPGLLGSAGCVTLPHHLAWPSPPYSTNPLQTLTSFPARQRPSFPTPGSPYPPQAPDRGRPLTPSHSQTVGAGGSIASPSPSSTDPTPPHQLLQASRGSSTGDKELGL